MNKQEALKQIEEQRDMILDLHGWGVFGYIKGIINQLDEPQKIELPKVDFKKSQKVKVPEFIEDWIFKCQLLNNFSLFQALDSNTIHLYAKKSEFVKKWLKDKKNQELFARAWLTDYEAEEESKYRVKLKNTNDYLNETEVGFHFYNNWKNNKTFTRKELEYSDFGWVLDCPGIELEEVE